MVHERNKSNPISESQKPQNFTLRNFTFGVSLKLEWVEISIKIFSQPKSSF